MGKNKKLLEIIMGQDNYKDFSEEEEELSDQEKDLKNLKKSSRKEK